MRQSLAVLALLMTLVTTLAPSVSFAERGGPRGHHPRASHAAGQGNLNPGPRPGFGHQDGGPSNRRFDNRQERQAGRIGQGLKSGELTRPEARRLAKGQRHVNQMEKRFNRDGELKPWERRRLEKASDIQSRRIHRQKNDAQQRPEPQAEG